MKAIISGQAAVAVFFDGEKMWSVNLDNLDKKIRCSESDLRFLFAGVTDLVELEDVTEEEALKELEQAWKKDRAMHLILILLDNEEAEETRQLAAECLEEFLPDSEVEEFVFNRMYAAPLPNEADLPGAMRYAEEVQGTYLHQLLNQLKSDQSEITHLCNAWNALPIKLFGSLEDVDTFKQAAIRAGAFRLFVAEDYRYNKILSKLLDAPQFRVHPKAREILTELQLIVKADIFPKNIENGTRYTFHE